VLPIVVRAEALAPDIPARDLWVSPRQALGTERFTIVEDDLAQQAECGSVSHLSIPFHVPRVTPGNS